MEFNCYRGCKSNWSYQKNPLFTVEQALRLSKVFVRSTEGWLKLQLQYDLWVAEQNTDLKKQPDFFRISDKLLLIKVLK